MSLKNKQKIHFSIYFKCVYAQYVNASFCLYSQNQVVVEIIVMAQMQFIVFRNQSLKVWTH